MEITIKVVGLEPMQAALAALATALLNLPVIAAQQPEAAITIAKPIQAAPAPVTEPEPAPSPNLPQPGSVDRDTVRAKFAELARQGKRDQLKEVLATFKVDNVSSIPDGLLHQVYAVLEGLQG